MIEDELKTALVLAKDIVKGDDPAGLLGAARAHGRINQREGRLGVAPCFGNERDLPAVLGAFPGHGFVEVVQNVFGSEPERGGPPHRGRLTLATPDTPPGCGGR